MKWKFTLILFFTAFTHITAQEIKGIWRGTFEDQAYNAQFGKFFTRTYKYEVQINKLPDNSLEGVTYSYESTNFYGKASLKGRYDKKAKTLTIKETKMIEMRNISGGDGCLMTCYLDYKKQGNEETLSGTFTGVNIRDGSPCDGGTVNLKKVPESKFKKEDFLLKKEEKLAAKKPTMATNKPKPNSNNIVRTLPKNNPNFADNPPPKTDTKPANAAVTNTNPAPKQITIPKGQTPIKKAETTKNIQTPKTTTTPPNKVIEEKILPKNNIPETKEPVTINVAPIAKPKIEEIEKPKILEERKNKLGNTVVVDNQDVLLEFYDNGQIDGDVISVYKNNELVINKKLLSTEPLTMKLHFTEPGQQINLYTIAETLGETPPNTALMVVTFGGKRQEILLTSDTKTNALTVIEYNKASRKY